MSLKRKTTAANLGSDESRPFQVRGTQPTQTTAEGMEKACGTTPPEIEEGAKTSATLTNIPRKRRRTASFAAETPASPHRINDALKEQIDVPENTISAIRGRFAFLRKRVKRRYKIYEMEEFELDIFMNLVNDPEFTDNERVLQSIRYLDTTDVLTEDAVQAINERTSVAEQLSYIKQMVKRGKRPKAERKDFHLLLDSLRDSPRSDPQFWDKVRYLMWTIDRPDKAYKDQCRMVYDFADLLDPTRVVAISLAFDKRILDKLEKLSKILPYLQTRTTNNENVKRETLFVTSNRSPNKICSCPTKHSYAFECNLFQNASSLGRKREIVVNMQACLNCLRVGHWKNKCRIKTVCSHCGEQHHSTFCVHEQIS